MRLLLHRDQTMADDDSKTTPKDDDDKKRFVALKPFIEANQTLKLERGELFRLCIRSSLVKCYEFNLLVRREEDKELAFFWIPSLRGICEDLIVLNFIKGLPKPERESLINLMMQHDICTRVETQVAFFSVARPQQPVLNYKDVDKRLAELESKIRVIWKAHGWPGMKRGAMPQIRQIAEKQGNAILGRLYDYLYRLTSGTVHFSVQSLLRLGWGTTKSTTFSTSNFSNYFSMFGQVYGSYLFCLYFEFFGRYLRPGPEVKQIVDEIRESLLLNPRWPEMVTFEEMNLTPPKTGVLNILYSVLQAQKTKRLMK